MNVALFKTGVFAQFHSFCVDFHSQVTKEARFRTFPTQPPFLSKVYPNIDLVFLSRHVKLLQLLQCSGSQWAGSSVSLYTSRQNTQSKTIQTRIPESTGEQLLVHYILGIRVFGSFISLECMFLMAMKWL
jgi:hypothetical protein